MKNYENYDPLFPDQPVVDLYLPIWSNLPAFKSKPAFIWIENDTSKPSFLTYSQLNSSATSISSMLPLQRGQTVVVLCSPGLELIKTIFACQRAGLVIVPIYPSLPTEQNYQNLLKVLSQTKPKAAIARRSYIKNIQQHNDDTTLSFSSTLRNLTWIATEDIIIDAEPKETRDRHCEKVNPSSDETYLIQYTSGATSPPKAVTITAGSAAHNARLARKAYDLNPNSVIVSWLPQYHDCGLMFLLLTVVSGSTCVLTSPTSFLKRPRVWLEMISDFGATCSPVPSFALPLVLKRGNAVIGENNKISLGSLRNLILINEPIYQSTLEEFVNAFRPLGLDPSSVSPSYGLAENCTFVSTSWRASSGDTMVPSHNKLLPSARLGGATEVDADVDIVVVNEDTLELVEDGVEGEILVSSPSNALGYLGLLRLTHEVFFGRLSGRRDDRRCYVRTGDRGVVKGKERFLYVTGRCVDVIKLRKYSEQVHAHYVEASAYSTCPRFLRGGCLAAFDVDNVVVVVVAEISLEIDSGFLMREMCEGIRRGVFKDEGIEVGLVALVKSGCVPKTTSGKVKRWEAKKRLLDGQMRVVFHMAFGNFTLLSSRFQRKDFGVDGFKGEHFLNFSTSLDQISSLSRL